MAFRFSSVLSSCYVHPLLAHTNRLLPATTTRLLPAFITNRNISSSISTSSSSSSSPPWLMLPPAFNKDNDTIAFNFYSLSDNTIRTFTRKNFHDLMPNPRLFGSSHGWLAMFKRETLDSILYNPITDNRVTLPPILNLPNFEESPSWFPDPEKLILSSSPDDDTCRAVMIYNFNSKMAVCCPSRSDKWAPLGEPSKQADKKKGYRDVAYSSRRNLFFALNRSSDLETWDLSDLSCPKMVSTVEIDYSSLELSGGRVEYLVVDDEDDRVLVVSREVTENVGHDGTVDEECCKLNTTHSHMTCHFDVLEYKWKEGVFDEVDGLGDVAIFVGVHTGSAVRSAARFPEVKEGSIYFTDPYGTMLKQCCMTIAGHDVGVFDFEKETVFPCYYPRDIRSLKLLDPPPMWFFPTEQGV